MDAVLLTVKYLELFQLSFHSPCSLFGHLALLDCNITLRFQLLLCGYELRQLHAH